MSRSADEFESLSPLKRALVALTENGTPSRCGGTHSARAHRDHRVGVPFSGRRQHTRCVLESSS
jgi:hypothetical protein